MKSPSYVPDGQIHFGKQNSQFEIAPIQVDDISEFNSQSRPVSGALNQVNENTREQEDAPADSTGGIVNKTPKNS